MKPHISAIIPTFNRSDYLRKAIQSLVAQTLPKDEYEIIVVDNRSTDGTKQIVTHEFAHVANLRYLHEPTLGLNQARNTGWRAACGEYIAFLDDDAIAGPDWLEKIVQTFDSIVPRAGCVGGKIIPIWEAPRPAWLSDELALLYTVIDTSSPRLLSEGEYVFGANIAFRNSALEAVGAFMPGLDRIGKKLLSNGEILVQIDLDRIGHLRFYNPAVVVHHHVPASRLTQSWMVSRMYWQGVSEALLEVQIHKFTRWQRFRLGLHRLRRFIVDPELLSVLATHTNTAERFRSKCRAFSRWGNILSLLGLSN